MSSNMPFEIIFISYDDDRQAFDRCYKTMPWKALPYGSLLAHILHKGFDIKDLPILIVFETNTGEILTKNGFKLINHLKMNAIEQWSRGQQISGTLPLIPPDECIWTTKMCDECEVIKPIVGLRYNCKI
ncbi:unnamed protein product [Didymodactylos carnosus]|uniref:protein-disulfide reductase n=1 Tax=Didymodactylos carnosus TaxID=1234261 RepID=A0A814KIU1_9BILA|nr:unnamed protein product [Didymodactylos carnosus]CAF1051415.1 unnamed protein product [Didymodactylos carnosus]CAF3734827.1 unnamed protein product [Didymodactylos carnosus]CAF3820873.1 unnamed protein product [Didymodactylos carnosus]